MIKKMKELILRRENNIQAIYANINEQNAIESCKKIHILRSSIELLSFRLRQLKLGKKLSYKKIIKEITG